MQRHHPGRCLQDKQGLGYSIEALAELYSLPESLGNGPQGGNPPPHLQPWGLLTDCEVKPTWEGNTIGNWNSQAVLVHPNLQTLQWPFLFISVCGVPSQTECLDTSLSQPVGVQVASHLVGRDRGGC